MNFSPKDPAEVIAYGFDFAKLLAVGETLSTATASMRCTAGVDVAPAAMISGQAVISGTSVKQTLIGGVAGCTYLFGIQVTTSAGQTFVESATLKVEERD